MRKTVMVSKQISTVLGEPFFIEFSGLESGQNIRIDAKTKDSANRVWGYQETLRADINGKLNIATNIPCEGAYQGIDAYELIYEMELVEPSFPPYFLQDGMKKLTISLCITLEDQVLEEMDLTFDLYQAEVTQIEIQENFSGKFFLPKKLKGPLPAVLVLGGSLGGFNWSEQVANYLASHGYAALAVAYFDWNGAHLLPNQLANVPLEPCLDAMKWLASHSTVDSNKLAIIGYSKGAELALLLASKLEKNDFQALVTLSPSSHIFAGFSMEEALNTSSWSYQGAPVPYLPYPKTNHPLYETNLYDLHSEAIKQSSKEIWEQARISVEKIESPMLIVTGVQDSTWPSVEMVDTIEVQTSSKLIKKVILEEAGHDFTLPYLPIVTNNDNLQKEKIELARRKTWDNVREFLKQTL
ncbi:acyl-CoA thioester hydrolase/BAAT C-terminal domain-containing protein [Bacillus nitratireducens]|uniref:acyl-CoA thioesterase/bile acid-CoA:amino acid N-acyltransferase family protein n=1 Tax=Bacillus nitratireducens TaxID=2026193 RepID=UPI002E1FD9A6|nr:acyl-CoA thioester hydrolase/BAAT C-terminal domain-containing protein [Bacillus nitratireducens]